MVENFGQYLKHERELRGVALEEISQATKIHIRFLEALENGEFDLLPGEVFIKGYIRSYAKVIGFDSEEMVNAYDDSVGKNRIEEFEKTQAANQKIRAGKKNLAGLVIGSAALLGVLFVGYIGVRFLVDANKKNPTEILSRSDSSLNKMNTEDLSVEEPNLEEESIASNEKEADPQMDSDFLQDPSASSAMDSNAQSDSGIESPPTPEPNPQISMTEVEKPKLADLDPDSEEQPSRPPDLIKEEPKTPIKPEEIEKPSDFSEKPVIIQHVAEEAEKVEKDPRLSETDSKPLHLRIQVQGNSWFNVTVDGGVEEDFILPGGSSKNIYGNEKFRLTIGNRRGTLLFLNGQSIDLPPGTSDVIRDFDITANLIE